MENICPNYSTNEEKDFINKELINNRIKFFSEFLDDDKFVKYVVQGIGEDLILNREQLMNLIHSNYVSFEIVSDETCIGILNDIPFIIEYL